MNLKIVVIFAFLLPLLLIGIGGGQSPPCNQICGGHGAKPVPYPFGFSPGCPIKLNCGSDLTPAVDDFPIQSFGADTIMINVPAKCERPLDTIWRLFRGNMAPTILNGMLLLNCSKPINDCLLPTTMVETHFQMSNCGSDKVLNENISCYSDRKYDLPYMNLNKLKGIECGFLFSTISAMGLGHLNMSGVSLGVQLFQLGWWLNGDCRCSSNGNCTKIVSPVDGNPGYRCSCSDGFVGDGYEDGLGCRRESWSCPPGKYITGQCKGSARVGVLLGGIIIGACLMTTAALICCYIHKLSKDQKRKRTNLRLYEATGITIPIYPYKEIEKATNFFCEKQCLGTGAFGTVYAGKLNEEWVAIKRLKYADKNATDRVLNEIKLISSVSHPNLVKLMGCSIDNNEQFLVYEYMPNGTLSEHLHHDGRIDVVLPWHVRLDIAVDTARAIAHLHSSTEPPIFHRDVKSSNILLDFNFKCKVADFGLSRVGMTTDASHISTSPQGTPGYLDPQYHQDFQLSDKSDVYSFGVVLIEIMTGLKAVDFSRPTDQINLAMYAMDRIGKGKLEEIIDPSINLLWDKGTLSSIRRLAELAFRCLTFNRDMRPSMIEVATELERLRFDSCNAVVAVPSSSLRDILLREREKTKERKSLPPLRVQGRASMEVIKELSPISTDISYPSDQSNSSPSSFILGSPNS